MTGRGNEEPPSPRVIVEYPPDHDSGRHEGVFPRTLVREYRSNSGKGSTYGYVYYGPRKGRLSTVKLGLVMAAVMATLFVLVALGGLIFLGLFAVLTVGAVVGRIFKRK
ncbi:MAG: hypothetical protein KJ650_01115 [Firmicutes bacterium]|jgi:hypothetical protein|nr:hypothetical protein [Bacillota bacterium]MBV1728434.1 hypothetical protein [Desulforudis sp.]MDQ7788922.1 hypothetical protein [Clostridia bacterium]MDZ7610714.1 hypothetical protein [Eubacteriales bacterium]MBU4555023.1 hypothetical protein [Bacillota bacterium]